MHGNYPNRPNRVRENVAKPESVSAAEAELAPSEMVVGAAPEQSTVGEKKAFGIVSECAMLSIRTMPTSYSDFVAIIPAGTELMLDLENSTEGFFKVCTAAGIEGFCMKKYVKIKA